MSRRSVEVFADWSELGRARRMGALHVDQASTKEVASFEYDASWLASGKAQVLDPRLSLAAGPQFPSGTQSTFGVFKDSAPDKFGRALMRRREAQAAKVEHRKARVLSDFDYLLGVHDAQRIGALRFRRGPTGPFVDDHEENAAPPMARLRDLEAASLALEREGIEDDPRYARLLALLAPGSSLGGARPKAGVVDTDGRLWICKFPSADDDHDVGAWEVVAQRLAARAGVVVPQSSLVRLGHKHHAFLTRRFDRVDGGGRIHFASAMTLLDRSDGDDADTGASYLELAELLVRSGANVATDLEQLWRRIVFSMCISNVDDHLRNHGFLLDPQGGWRLAPAYDLNPVATGEGLKLNVDDASNPQDLSLAREVAPVFRVSARRASTILDEVVAAVSTWRSEATAIGLGRAAQEELARAFRLAER